MVLVAARHKLPLVVKAAQVEQTVLWEQHRRFMGVAVVLMAAVVEQTNTMKMAAEAEVGLFTKTTFLLRRVPLTQ